MSSNRIAALDALDAKRQERDRAKQSAKSLEGQAQVERDHWQRLAEECEIDAAEIKKLWPDYYEDERT